MSAGICPDCGRPWDELARRGRLGCPGCWSAFRSELAEFLSESQGTDRHEVGEDALEQARSLRRRELESRLASAVAREDYAEAGRLRDLLRGEDD